MSPGELYGDYKAVRFVGRGNMGVVYEMIRLDNGARVAVKIVPFSDTDTARANIVAEERGARVQQGLSDLRVVKVYRVHMNDDDLNVEMEFVEGSDLNEHLERGPLAMELAVEIAIQLCEMLRNLGRVVHGDLKPRNIRLCGDNSVKVMDFGIAKEAASREGTINEYHTVRYASPERLQTGKASAASDLWSVVVILYEMLTGRHPFQTAKDRMRERICSNLGPDTLPAWIPQPLVNILTKGLSRLPERRYPTAAALLDDLRKYLAGQPVSAPEPNPDLTEPTCPHAAFSTEQTAPPPPVAPPPPRNGKGFPFFRLMWLLLALAIAGLAYPQGMTWWEISQLAEQIERGDIKVDEAWKRYEAIQKKPILLVPYNRLKLDMKKLLVQAGEKPIHDYRQQQAKSMQDPPSVIYERAWQRAEGYLTKAHQIDPNDTDVKGEIAICHGHVLRIGCKKATKTGLPKVEHQAMLQKSVEEFERAGQILPFSPDPYLGLARISFELKIDPVKGKAELNEAQSRGFTVSDSMKMQMSVSFCVAAEQAESQAHGFRGVPTKERQLLESSRQEFQEVYNLYAEVKGGDPRWLKRATQGLDRVNQRLAELDSAEATR
jgi:serine/threonine protein kinase